MELAAMVFAQMVSAAPSLDGVVRVLLTVAPVTRFQRPRHHPWILLVPPPQHLSVIGRDGNRVNGACSNGK